MNHQTFKIYNEADFKKITKGIKVAQCMRLKSSSNVPDFENAVNHLDDLCVSNSLSCSFCNTVFEDQMQQRLHYKLDWHRYNLKQKLHGLRSVTEEEFNILTEKEDVSSISGSELDSDDDDTSENGCNNEKNSSSNQSCTSKSSNRKLDKAKKVIADECTDSSDNETPDVKKDDALSSLASRHTKVFFENDEGNIFSIYRCLLHNKKEIPEIDNEMITQALDSGKKSLWTIIMLGGGHFAAAVFDGGQAIVHKTFHSYTVRAKQGSSQNSRDSRSAGSHPKSAGASLRRYNEASLIQHIQEILYLWSSHLSNSSLILYRAVGPHNRTVLFGGKNPPLDKNDSRLRPLPFPTRRATFSEVNRVYDILSSMEIYGTASIFTNSFPISPRQPARTKSCKNADDELKQKVAVNLHKSDNHTSADEKKEVVTPERQNRTPKSNIDRAKPRKSPHRPLPDIVAKLARSSSESDIQEYTHGIIEQSYEIEFNDHLKAFENTVPRYMKNKKNRHQKRKLKKDRDDVRVNEVLSAMKFKLWSSCRNSDEEVFASSITNLLEEISRCKQVLDNKVDNLNECNLAVLINMDDLEKLINEQDEEGNTMLHLAASNNMLKIIWTLMELGSDPCKKNKKLQTPYVVSVDKRTRSEFRRFMGVNPDKYNYNKSQIPGPLTEETERQVLEKKKAKKEREKINKRNFELKKQEETEKQKFLHLTDREKKTVIAEKRMQDGALVRRCFQCGSQLGDQVAFEYNSSQFCSMPCLKEHRLHNKFSH